MIFTANLGFFDRGIEDYFETYKQICEHGELFETNGTKYIRWTPGEGVELWTKLEENGPLANYLSYFAGGARMKVALIEKTPRAKRTYSEGAFLCRSSACAGDGWISGRLPFVFDTPDFHRYDRLSLPLLCDVQLTGFVFRVKGFEKEEEFDEEFPEDEEGYCWDYKHFVPSYCFKPRGEEGELQPASAVVSGYVIDTGIITNPATGLDFCWMKVETIGGEVDMVCSPDKLSGFIVIGGIAIAHCYLYGRILEDDSN